MIEMRDFMINLRYQGCRHTWTNNQPENPITKNLDRALMNEKWGTRYPHNFANFLSLEFSDHTPYIIDLACPLPLAGSKPFKFLNLLTSHPLFSSKVETA